MEELQPLNFHTSSRESCCMALRFQLGRVQAERSSRDKIPKSFYQQSPLNTIETMVAVLQMCTGWEARIYSPKNWPNVWRKECLCLLMRREIGCSWEWAKVTRSFCSGQDSLPATSTPNLYIYIPTYNFFTYFVTGPVSVIKITRIGLICDCPASASWMPFSK